MMHELQPGDPRMIGPYRLRGRLGAGGMGQVFLGLSAGGRAVAVKVIRAELTTDPEFRARFRREVAVARKVSGLFTAPVIDADLDGAVPWLATSYVSGPSLAEAVSGHGPLPAGSVLALAAGLAEGLSAIHAAGVVHRDLKPANVLLAADGPRVIDFGISRAAENGALTHTGLVVGSPGFMSPEQAEGREVGPPSDIFSLGAVLAFAAAGEGPFGTGSTPALVYRVVHNPANLEHLPALVRPLVERCLAKDPGQRPTAAGLLAGAAPPSTGWLPEPVTRTFLQLPALAAAPDAGTAPIPVITGPAASNGQLTVTAAQLSPPLSRPGSRRGWHPLAAAAIIAGLLGAGATAGFALTASTSPTHATRSAQRTVAGPRIAPAAATSAPVAPARTSSPATSTSSTPAAYMVPSTPPPATTAPPPAASPTPSTSPSPSTSAPASTAPTPTPATSAPTTAAGY
jgi:eukaryotic-like serine/threonine-protein kinase